MLAIERKNEILGRLRNEKRVLVSELAEYYNVTEETIRRDLDKLEKEGYATKTYGGAILGNSTKTDLSYAVRNKANVEAKKVIANLVTDLIEDGDHLMIDHSSTCYFSVKKLKEKKNLTVITNSVELASEICSIESWNVYMPGGQLRPESMALSGPASYEILHTYHVDKTLFSCKGIDMDETMLVTRLEAFGIPCLRQYPNDGQFGKLILGISGSGVDIFVPASVWEDACELIRESDDETEEEQ